MIFRLSWIIISTLDYFWATGSGKERRAGLYPVLGRRWPPSLQCEEPCDQSGYRNRVSFSLLTCFFAICLSNQQQTHDMTCICSVTLPLMMSQVVELMPATLTEIEFCFRDWSSRRLLLHQVCVPNSFPFTSCICLESEPFPFSLRLQRRMGGASSKPLRHSVASQTHNQDRKSQC